MFLAVNWKGTKGKPGCGWVVQPCYRVSRGHWKYYPPVAGPFKTKREATEMKRAMTVVG